MIVRSIAHAASFLYLSSTLLYAVAPNTVVSTINVGVNPAGIALTLDNRYAYVANNNNYRITGGDSVSVLDLTDNLPSQTITHSSFNEPYTITINPSGTKAYVTNSNSTTVTVIDVKTNTVTGVINGFDGPSGMAISLDGNFGYVNNYGGPEGLGSGNGKTIRVVDLNSNSIVGDPIEVGLAPAALDITPDGKFVYVICYQDGNPGTGTISIIQTSNNTVVEPTIRGFSGPFAISITSNGRYAYVTNFGSNDFAPIGKTVSVVDLTSNMVIATPVLAIQPSGVDVTPDGRFAYASNYNTLYAGSDFSDLTAGQGTVNIIDTKTNTVIPPTIEVGQSPANVKISSNGQYAYVSNYTSNTISVIALQSFQIKAQVRQISNRYLTQLDLINELTWTASGKSLPVSYSIYRDSQLTDLAGTVFAFEPAVFLDHNRKSGVAYTYYIVGTNKVGTTSEPVAVEVIENC